MHEQLDVIIEALQRLKSQVSVSGTVPSAVESLISLVRWECDLGGRILQMEGPCEEWFGLSSGLLLGRSLVTLWKSPDLESVADWQARVVELASHELAQRWVQLDSERVHDPDGKLVGYRGTMFDVTSVQRERLSLEQQIESLRQINHDHEVMVRAYQRQMRLQEALMLGFGRDMRTMMHRLLGLLAMLRQRPLDRQQDDCADGIHSSLEHLLQLAQPLEEAIGRGFEAREVVADFDLRQAIAEVCRWMGAEVAAKGLQLQISVANSVPHRLRGDGVKLRQVLMQLVDNAVKFSSQGKIVVEASGLQEIRFCVRDSGEGMTPEKLERLFQGSLLDGDLQSTGLGLRLARHLVEQLGGKIWADSLPGKGTSIYFTVRFEEESGTPPDARAPRVSHSETLQLLLAEDDPISQKVTLRLLSRLGHKVDIVSSGLQVLEALQRANYDVVLLDVEMPGLDGLETARQIKRRFMPPPYLIALTAGTSAKDRREVMLSGMNDYLSKPLRQEELVDALARFREHG